MVDFIPQAGNVVRHHVQMKQCGESETEVGRRLFSVD